MLWENQQLYQLHGKQWVCYWLTGSKVCVCGGAESKASTNVCTEPEPTTSNLLTTMSFSMRVCERMCVGGMGLGVCVCGGAWWILNQSQVIVHVS